MEEHAASLSVDGGHASVDRTQEAVEGLGLQEPLDPNEAFFGGRTNAVWLYVRVDEFLGEEIRYYDYSSLYPYVNKTGKYPVAHPEFIYDPDTTDISAYFGLVKCTVLPPEHPFHPVLPHHTHQKLTFPLCQSCVEANVDRPLCGEFRSTARTVRN